MTTHQEALLGDDERPPPGDRFYREPLRDDVLVIGATAADFVITALGVPQPQGSKTRAKWGMYDDNKKVLDPWRGTVSAATRDAMVVEYGDEPALPIHYRHSPIAVDVTFTFARAQGDFGTGRNAHLLKDSAPQHCTKGKDIDKLCRAVLDSIVDAGLLETDKQVVSIRAIKVYPGGHPDALQINGAVIRVRALG